MGIINTTYSYKSKIEALEKMLSQLDNAGISHHYSEKYGRFYVNEKDKQRFIVIDQRTDIFGKIYFECYLS